MNTTDEPACEQQRDAVVDNLIEAIQLFRVLCRIIDRLNQAAGHEVVTPENMIVH
jgi:hypothetical protein